MYTHKYTLSQAAAMLNITNIGRQKIYIILKKLGIVDDYNRPLPKYINLEYLAEGSPLVYSNGRICTKNVTLVVDQMGLNFLEKTINNYLKENPIPTVPKKKRVNREISI